MLYEIGISTECNELACDAAFIGHFYKKALKPLKFIKPRKIIIALVNEFDPEDFLGEDSPVCFVRIRYDTSKYIALQDMQSKKAEISKIFQLGLSKLGEKLNWDTSVFYGLHDELIKENFNLIKAFKKKSNGAKEKVYAQFAVSLEMKCYIFRVNFEKNKELFCSLKIYEGFTNDMYWKFLFKYEYWESADIFVVASYQKDIFFKCNYKTCTVDVVFDVSNKSQDQLEEKLNTWSFDIENGDRSTLFLKHWTPITKEIFDK